MQTVFGEAGAAIYSEMNQDPLDPDAFALVLSGSSATIYPMAGGAIEVDWGDRNANERCGNVFTAGGAISCEYDLPGTYRVSIIGDMTAYGDEAGLETNSGISRVLQWGNTGLTDLSFAFYGASKLMDVPDNLPPGLTSMNSTFFYAYALNDPDIARWDTSSVENFQSTFKYATNFNVDIGDWDVSSATYMHHIFYRATAFNQDINDWDISNVTSLRGAFRGATAFSQDLNDWDTSKVNSFMSMFSEKEYNGNISSWDTSSATTMAYMLRNKETFNQDISGWDVSNVQDFTGMLGQNSVFSQDLSGWDTSSAIYMEEMFDGSASFSSDLSSWCVPLVASRPTLFSDGSGISAEPVWGTCP